MSTQRQRLTWAAREATAPPAIPGYGVEDQDHPAHQPEPSHEDYAKGDPSAWAEDPHPGPYGDSGKPALPGYGVEDQDHPAHAGQVGRQADLKETVRRRAAKCMVIARHTLGKTASTASLEDQAFALMDLPDAEIEATLQRIAAARKQAGGFFAEDEFLGGDEDLLGCGEEADEEDGLFAGDDDLLARCARLEREVRQLRADQNDPDDDTLAPGAKSEDEEKKEEAGANKEAAVSKEAAWFAISDGDRDGFVTASEWRGPKSAFAALDLDGDGIVAFTDVKTAADEEAEDEEAEDEVASKKARKAKKSEDEEADEDEVASKKARKAKKSEDEEADEDEDEVASKKAFGHFADLDDDELEMLSAMEFGLEDEGETACGDDGRMLSASDDEDDEDETASKKAKKSEDEEAEDEEADEDSDKEASFFAGHGDPMGLSDESILTAEDEAAFANVFGKNASDEEAEDEEAEDEEAEDASKKARSRKAKKSEDEEADEDEVASKKASRTASVRPQPRKKAAGVRSLGSVTGGGAGRGNEVDELSKLWATAPDVSDAF